MSVFYKRFCEAEFSLRGKKTQTPSDLKYQFLCTKNLYGTPNSLTLSIFNPSKKIALSEIKNSDLIFKAGYKENLKTVCFQNVTKASFNLQKPDRILEIEALDGYNNFAFKKINLSFGKNTFLNQVLTKVLSEINLPQRPLSVSPAKLLTRFKSGYSYTGSISSCLDELGTQGNFLWSVQNGNLLLLDKNSFLPKIPLIINTNDVFIKQPEKIEDANYLDTQKEILSGVLFTLLLKPEIEPGDTITLTSSTVSGTFRVEEILHSGDTYSNQFFTQVKAFSLV